MDAATVVDWTIVVELVKALAWPVVVVFLGLTAKPLIQGIADRVKVIKAGGNEIQLDDVPKAKELEAPKETIKALAAPKEPQLELPPAPVAEPDLVRYAPAGAIINAWARLEDVMRREAVRLGLIPPNAVGVASLNLVGRLKAANVIAEDTEQSIKALRRIRNEVAHGGAVVSEEPAAQFVATAELIIKAIEAYADIVQLRRIFGELHVDGTVQEQIKQIVVGQLSPRGVSADPEAARAMAETRRGMWGVRSKGVIKAVSERDAALLIARGAQLGDPEQLGRG